MDEVRDEIMTGGLTCQHTFCLQGGAGRAVLPALTGLTGNGSLGATQGFVWQLCRPYRTSRSVGLLVHWCLPGKAVEYAAGLPPRA